MRFFLKADLQGAAIYARIPVISYDEKIVYFGIGALDDGGEFEHGW